MLGFVRHMTADDNLNQRVQIAQDRIVDTTLPEARTGERDPVPEPARKVGFAERVDEQTPEGTVATSSSSSSSSSSSYPSSSQTSIAPSMQVDECNQDSSQKTERYSWC